LSYLVLARKWRPQTFAEILGQEAVVQTIQNAIKQNRVAHAFLFSGPRGVGKTTLARVLSKALNCQSFDQPTITPCGHCSACVEITAGSAVDVLEIDGASNTSVDNVRELRETVRYMPASCRTKIYIIDEVHMLSQSAFNALLKTLEEPPSHVVFMFATTEAHKIPATILSRCQRYEFHRVGAPLLVTHLENICGQEGIRLPEGSLRVIAREAEGSVRDALSLLDQVTSFGTEGLSEDEVLRILGVVDRTLVSAICKAVLEGDAAAALDELARADESGHDMKQLARELTRWFRNLMVVKLAKDPERLLDVPDQELGLLKEAAASRNLETVERHFDQLARLGEELGRAGAPRLMMEMTLVRMALTPPLVPMEELIARMGELEERLRQGAPESAPAAKAQPAGAEAPLFSSEPAKAAPAAQPETGGTESALTWEGFMGFVEKKDQKLHALLAAGVFSGLSGREWRLSFPAGHFLLERLKGERNAARVKELMTECFGEGHRLVITEDTAPAAGPPRANRLQEEDKRRREAMDDPLIQALQNKLGGEIEEIKTK